MSAQFFGKFKAILADLTTIKGNLDANISTRAPSSTALSTAIWTAAKAGFLDAKISEAGGGEVSGNTLNVETFNSSGTFTVPAGFKGFVYVTLVGGGGAGGGSSFSVGGAGGGGGAVFYRWPIWLDQAVTTTVTVTRGAGGTGVSSGQGNPGGASSFGSFLTAYGGGGGAANGSGGNGGQLDAAGASASNASDEGNVEMLIFPHEIFPAYRNMRAGFFCPGAPGGRADATDPYHGWNCLYIPAITGIFSSFQDVDYPFSESFPGPTLGGNENVSGEAGGGGASWGNAPNAGSAGSANSGAGGGGATDGSNKSGASGGSGKCIVEYWS